MLRARPLDMIGGSHNLMSVRQRFTYLAGSLQWYGDLLSVAAHLLLVGVAFGATTWFLGFAALVVPAYAVVTVFRAVAVVRRSGVGTWSDGVGAVLLWMSLTVTVARASLRGLVRRTAPFVRTARYGSAVGWRQAVRSNPVEACIAVLGVLGIVVALWRTSDGLLLAALLLPGTMAGVGALVNSVAAGSSVDVRRQR
jgi:hypothetical protein